MLHAITVFKYNSNNHSKTTIQLESITSWVVFGKKCKIYIFKMFKCPADVRFLPAKQQCRKQIKWMFFFYRILDFQCKPNLNLLKRKNRFQTMVLRGDLLRTFAMFCKCLQKTGPIIYNFGPNFMVFFWKLKWN